MAPSKKRKDPPQSSTLLKFFSGGEGRAKKGRAQHAVPKPDAKQRIDTSQDIIIIDDSDSDCAESSNVRKTRRPASSSSSDVEFVEDEDDKPKVNTLLITREKFHTNSDILR
jgi:hypothetical protein